MDMEKCCSNRWEQSCQIVMRVLLCWRDGVDGWEDGREGERAGERSGRKGTSEGNGKVPAKSILNIWRAALP